MDVLRAPMQVHGVAQRTGLGGVIGLGQHHGQIGGGVCIARLAVQMQAQKHKRKSLMQ